MDTTENSYWYPGFAAVTVDCPMIGEDLIRAVTEYGKRVGKPVHGDQDSILDLGEEYIRKCCVRVNGLPYNDAMRQLLEVADDGKAYRTIVQQVNDLVEERLIDSLTTFSPHS